MAAPVYVLGGYQTDFARNWTKENKHIVAMLREAVLGGLEATGIDAKEVEVGHVGNFAAELYSMQGHLGAFLLDADDHRQSVASGFDLRGCRQNRDTARRARGFVARGRQTGERRVGLDQKCSEMPLHRVELGGEVADVTNLDVTGINLSRLEPAAHCFAQHGDDVLVLLRPVAREVGLVAAENVYRWGHRSLSPSHGRP